LHHTPCPVTAAIHAAAFSATRLNSYVGGQKIRASEDDPRYLVESEKSGKEAAHKPDALSKA
jgi:Hypervirulence associated proteins TUDOR domain